MKKKASKYWGVKYYKFFSLYKNMHFSNSPEILKNWFKVDPSIGKREIDLRK